MTKLSGYARIFFAQNLDFYMLNSMAKEIRNVYELLGIDQSDIAGKDRPLLDMTEDAVAPPTLPVLQPVEEADYKMKDIKMKPLEQSQPKGLLVKDFIKYPLIFLISFVFFYAILNSGALFARLQGAFTRDAEPEPQTEGTVLGVASPEYLTWVNKYFFRVNDRDAVGPNVDMDGDGLSNYQEYLLGTSLIKRDTDDDGYSDGQEVLNGYNPLTSGLLTEKQQDLIKDWDLVDVNNRISYSVITTLSQGPAAPSNLPGINYNLETSGEINIPKLGVVAPLVWSRSPDNFDDDLNRGVIHYPGTSLPGQVGVSYISGHSSNYPWVRSDYSYVFTQINKLEAGDEFFLTVYQADGEKITLRYVVFEKNRYTPEDQAQFISDTNDSIVNLSTCWPLGSLAERYVVSARLAGV